MSRYCDSSSDGAGRSSRTIGPELLAATGAGAVGGEGDAVCDGSVGAEVSGGEPGRFTTEGASVGEGGLGARSGEPCEWLRL